MTLVLPSLLELIGIVCGTFVVGAATFVMSTLVATLFMDVSIGEWLHLARWPVTLLATVLIAVWLTSLAA